MTYKARRKQANTTKRRKLQKRASNMLLLYEQKETHLGKKHSVLQGQMITPFFFLASEERFWLRIIIFAGHFFLFLRFWGARPFYSRVAQHGRWWKKLLRYWMCLGVIFIDALLSLKRTAYIVDFLVLFFPQGSNEHLGKKFCKASVVMTPTTPAGHWGSRPLPWTAQ